MLFRCRRCLYPCSKPDLWFDESGLCSACLAYDKRASVDWAERERAFLDLCRGSDGSHDVIVACSGGKDSTWQVLKCIELGLRPLAVTATTDHLSAVGRRNLTNIANLCDHVAVTPHVPTRRKISAWALREIGDISWCEHHLIWSVPAREAVARGIPIVLYGECPQNEYGAGPEGSEAETELTPAWIHEFGGLLGLRVSDVADVLKIEPRRLEQYRCPPGGYNAIFMGAYFPWDGHENYKVADKHGFRAHTADVEGSICPYENVDNYQTGIHDYLRFLKFGYGRAIDIACNHIRRGRMTREAAIEAIKGRDGAFPETYLGAPLTSILGRIGVSIHEFNLICKRFTNHAVAEWALQPESFQCK